MQTPFPATAFLATALAAPATAQLEGALTVSYTTPSTSVPLPYGIPLLLLEECSTVTIGDFSIDLAYDDGNSTADSAFHYDWAGAPLTLADTIIDGFGDPLDQVSVSCALTVVEELGRIDGNVGLYAFHIGPGGPIELRFAGAICATEVLEVVSPVAQTVELPLHVEGDILGAEAFGDAAATFARARIELQGSFGGTPVGPFLVSVESVGVVPEQDSILVSTTVPVAVPAGVSVHPLDLLGEVEVIAQAKSTGLFGSISGAATASATVERIVIGNLTGPGGAPLAPGTTVRSTVTGAVFTPVTQIVDYYCTGKTSSLGCVPFLLASGTPRATGAEPFVLSERDGVPDESGFLLYSFKKANLDFHGGKLCLKAPLMRTPAKAAKNTGPAPCSGILRRNFNNTIQSGNDPLLTPGRTVYAQWLQRDPADPTGFGDNLTNGVGFTIAP